MVTVIVDPTELRPGDSVIAVGEPECFECGAPWAITVNRTEPEAELHDTATVEDTMDYNDPVHPQCQ